MRCGINTDLRCPKPNDSIICSYLTVHYSQPFAHLKITSKYIEELSSKCQDQRSTRSNTSNAHTSYSSWWFVQSFWALLLSPKFPIQRSLKKDRPSARSSHTRWGLGKDYTSQALPLQSAMQRLSRTQDLLTQVGSTSPLRQACPSLSSWLSIQEMR